MESSIRSEPVDDLSQEASECACSESALHLEDVDNESSELWLIKAPCDFDIFRLSGEKVITKGKQKLKDRSEKKEKKHEICSLENSDLKCEDFSIILPDDKGKRRIAVQPFKGQMEIVKCAKSVTSCSAHYLPTCSTPTMPEGLQIRYKPFGSVSPVRTKSKKSKKKRKRMSDYSGSDHRSKWKKREHSEDGLGMYRNNVPTSQQSTSTRISADESDRTANTSVDFDRSLLVKEKKKKHKKRSEPIRQDVCGFLNGYDPPLETAEYLRLNDFPNRSTSKKKKRKHADD